MTNRKMKHLAPKLYNFDAFKVAKNSLMFGGLSPPSIVSSYRNGGICITHREYIRDIYAAQDFTTHDFDINPGLESSFPWLSQIAPSFEEYEWKGLVYEYKSMSSDAVLSSANSSALGTVVMATQYNALSHEFTNKKEMANYEYANSAKPSVTFVHPVECKPTAHPILYVRTTDNVTGDKRLYDIGSFQIAVQGCQSDEGVIGELWASFEICLYKPKFEQGSGSQTDMFIMPYGYTPQNIGAVLSTGARTLGSSNPDGVTTFTSPPQINGNLGGTISTTQERYSFPPDITSGFYEVVYNCTITGSPTGITTPSFSGFQNCSRIAINGFDDFKATQTVGTSVNINISAQIEILGPNASFLLAGIAWSGGTGALASFCVTELFGSLYEAPEGVPV